MRARVQAALDARRLVRSVPDWPELTAIKAIGGAAGALSDKYGRHGGSGGAVHLARTTIGARCHACAFAQVECAETFGHVDSMQPSFSGISDQQAAAMNAQGADCPIPHPPDPQSREARHHPLSRSGGGGGGFTACQWADSLGAIVIGMVGNEEKAKVAKAHGCDHSSIYTREDFVARVEEVTRSEKVPVVYDSVGKDTFMKSLDCLKPRGLMVYFGQASGPIGPVDLNIFAQKGSLFFTRPTLNSYAAKRADMLAMAKDLFEVVPSGPVKIVINRTYKVREAVQVHRDLAARKTIGSTILTVSAGVPAGEFS
jgi:hypothetical protein